LAIFFYAAANRSLVPDEIACTGNECSAEGTGTRTGWVAPFDSENDHLLLLFIFS
jgi:hypothetical protein